MAVCGLLPVAAVYSAGIVAFRIFYRHYRHYRGITAPTVVRGVCFLFRMLLIFFFVVFLNGFDAFKIVSIVLAHHWAYLGLFFV